MADNFAFTPGVGASGAADDIDGVLYPRVKVALGANNTNDGDISSSNPMPVTGTITAVTAITNALPAGTNAIGKLAANSGVDIGDVDVTSCALPTGASTAANQSTIIGHVDGIETLLGTIDGDTSTLAGAVAGTEMQVDVVSSALPTGAATAAKQPALGTAGTASTDVITVQGIASMTPLSVNATLGAETTKVIGTVNVAAGQTIGVTGTFYQETQPVSGTVTANLSATDNTVLDNIDADLTTVIGHVDGIETDTGAIKTAVETLDNAISGSEMQVDVVGALPAGTNAIGKLLPPDIDVTTHTNYAKKYYTSAGAATDGIVWSPAAGKRWHVVSMYLQTSADATVTLEDDLAGGDSPVWKSELKAGSGAFLVFPEKYPLASGEDAADLIVTTSAGNIYITITGYEV